MSDIASSLSGTVNGAGWAGVLSQRLGYAVSNGEPYYTQACTTSGQCVFPNAVIPQAAWSAPAAPLMKYVPEPNASGNFFSTSQFKQTLRDDETAFRTDANTGWGMLSAYYYFDDNSLDNPYPQSSIPGFSGLGSQRAQLLTLGDT